MDIDERNWKINREVFFRSVRVREMEDIVDRYEAGKGSDVRWGDGCNWHAFNALEDVNECFHLQVDEHINIHYLPVTDCWKAWKEYVQVVASDPKRAIALAYLKLKGVDIESL